MKARPVLEDRVRGVSRLQTDSSSANHALGALVGGRIIVTEQLTPGTVKKFLRGCFILQCEPGVVDPTLCGKTAALPAMAPSSSIIIDFVEPKKIVADSEQAKKLFDAGMSNLEIGEKMGWSRSYVTKALKYWYASRGREKPDGRRRRPEPDD